ncbi:MAG: hypothetical protein RJB13_904 [Pseudomonadota bacterium]
MKDSQVLQLHEKQVVALLDSWFESNFTRKCALPFDSRQTPEQVAKLAASLFKRGGNSLTDIHTGTIYPPSAPQAKEQQQKKTPVYFQNSLSQFFAQPDPTNDEGESFFICDSAVLKFHPTIEKLLNQRNSIRFIFEPTEQNKNLATVLQILNSFQNSPKKVIVIGGGVCCDVGGVAGALLDTPVHLVPTTLLSAVDAGIGGKSGVNHSKAGKNQIGRFVSLASVSIIPELFRSLTLSQIRQGVAEIVKHSYLAGTFHHWQSYLSLLMLPKSQFSFEHSDVIELIKQNIAFKSSVVMLDPTDKDIRNILNFGHTVAHLIEASQARGLSSFSHFNHAHPISHGVAVAIGMLALAESGLLISQPEGFQQFLRKILSAENITFPLELEFNSLESVRQILRQDKKRVNRENESVRLIVPRYGAMSQLERINDRKQFLKDNTLEIDTDELITLLKKIGIFN